ncbi:hypothetical protein [Mangrovibacterium diazotrophicum]|uniref:Amidohydrolase family protein n=1 Tax=Mangrovibacterium diazotrophicum TaxID=1261403 RepID=A0A419W9K2_9BACT|nr:hypothetical protein [Mangrovibacterium diazotrophicum]RKD92143.1 hypothetical protein BC643_2513 [Mangrovibacterium diazotrophicum]
MKFAAHYIITGTGEILPKGIVEVDQDGRIINLISNEKGLREQAGMEFHSGVICPAFPDIFQHLQLDELFEKVPELRPYQAFLPADISHPKAVFNWIKNIQLNDPKTELSELITLFCKKLSEVLNQPETGTIEIGKRPGLVLLNVMNYQNLRLTEDSRIRKLR